MKRKPLIIAFASAVVLAGVGFALFWSLQTRVQVTGPGPADSDGMCPTFQESYPQCEVAFGNSGLSVLNSFYETFFGEGAFEINGFTVKTRGEGSFLITADSNRGPLTSDIIADRLVRLGQEQEDGRLTYTHEASYCHSGRVLQNQIGFLGNSLNVQNIEYWTEDETFHFRLVQGGYLTAEVQCR